MNRISSFFVASLGLAVLLTALPARATDFYVKNSGSNSASGHTDATAWADFTNLNSHGAFAAGDNIYLDGGSTFTGELDLTGSGTSGAPITLTSYNAGAAKLERGAGLTCIVLTNGSYWTIRTLELCNSGRGVLVVYSNGTFGNQGITLQSLYFHDNNKPDIEFQGGTTLPTSSQFTCKNIAIQNCTISNVSYAPVYIHQFDSSGFSNQYCWPNLIYRNNTVNTYGFHFTVYGVSNGLFIDNYHTGRTGSGSAGTTGIFNMYFANTIYANNWMGNVPNTSSPDESQFDLEAYNDGTKFYSNFFNHTAGPAIELLQLGAGASPIRIPAQDYCTNIVMDGNIFEYNGSGNYNGWRSVLQAENENGNTITGTVSNNFYLEPTGWATSFLGGYTGTSWSGFGTPTNNTSIAAFATSHIDNAADQFSSTQGANQWSYTYWPGTGSHQNLTFVATNTFWGSTSTGYWQLSSGSTGEYVSQFDMRPSSNSAAWLYRVWTAPAAGTISVRGRVLKNQTGGGSLNVCVINNSSTIIWPGTGSPQSLGGSDQSGYDTQLDGVTVAAGDKISFCINNGSGIAGSSLVSWAPTIVYTSGGP